MIAAAIRLSWARLTEIFYTEGHLWALMIMGSLSAARGGVQLALGQGAYHPGYFVLAAGYLPVGLVALLMFASGLGQLASALAGLPHPARWSTAVGFVCWLFTATMYALVPHSPSGLWALAVTHAILAVISGLLFLRLGRVVNDG